MIRLGGGGVVGDSDDPRELARAHRAFGYRAAYCPPVTLDDTDRLRDIREAFAAEDVVIAEVGAWGNLVAYGPAKRKENFENACRRLAIADAVGARCCVDYIGSPMPHAGPDASLLSKEGFDLAVRTARDLIDAVHPRRTRFCLEMMPWQLPDGPEVYRELIRAVDRQAFGAHMDPVNIVTSPRTYFDNGALIARCFEILGTDILSCHAKDIILRKHQVVRLEECPPGHGNLDYRTYIRELDRLGTDAPLMLEHLGSSQEYAAARDHLVSVAGALGVET